MPGPLQHSAADVLLQLLISSGEVDDPSGTAGEWPGYVSYLPSDPDNCVCLTDTTGLMRGRVMANGEQQDRQGVQLKVRAYDHATGFAKTHDIAQTLDSQSRVVVSLGGSRYVVWNVSRSGDVLPLGKESPTSERVLFTVNATVTLRMI